MEFKNIGDLERYLAIKIKDIDIVYAQAQSIIRYINRLITYINIIVFIIISIYAICNKQYILILALSFLFVIIDRIMNICFKNFIKSYIATRFAFVEEVYTSYVKTTDMEESTKAKIFEGILCKLNIPILKKYNEENNE